MPRKKNVNTKKVKIEYAPLSFLKFIKKLDRKKTYITIETLILIVSTRLYCITSGNQTGTTCETFEYSLEPVVNVRDTTTIILSRQTGSFST